MSKVIFLPLSIATGLVAGLLGKRIFNLLWSVIDDRDPPQPEDRGARIGRLAVALGLQGAVFRLAKGLVDHGTRRTFARLTGAWPGEGKSEPEPQSA